MFIFSRISKTKLNLIWGRKQPEPFKQPAVEVNVIESEFEIGPKVSPFDRELLKVSQERIMRSMEKNSSERSLSPIRRPTTLSLANQLKRQSADMKRNSRNNLLNRIQENINNDRKDGGDLGVYFLFFFYFFLSKFIKI